MTEFSGEFDHTADEQAQSLPEYEYKKPRHTARNAAISLSLATIAALGVGYAASTPTGSINREAAFNFNDRNDQMSSLAMGLTGSLVRVSCDDALLEREGGLKITVDGQDYPVRGRVYPFGISENSFAIAPPVMVLREEICDTILDDTNKLPEIKQVGAARVTHYEAPIEFARAVVTLLHEREHTFQVFNEAAANCYAYQKLPAALAVLGMNTEHIPIVTRGLLNDMSSDAYPSSYYSSECRDGGLLDLDISDTYLQQ